jgi:hypothetical protein
MDFLKAMQVTAHHVPSEMPLLAQQQQQQS